MSWLWAELWESGGGQEAELGAGAMRGVDTGRDFWPALALGWPRLTPLVWGRASVGPPCCSSLEPTPPTPVPRSWTL